MIIENPDALRAWLTACLEPKCDADPAALSKYVMALVKKDKSEKELRDICLDQLDVFLQKGTKPFVELLFETLASKSYLKSPVVQPVQPLNGAQPEPERPVPIAESSEVPLNGSTTTNPGNQTPSKQVATVVPVTAVANPIGPLTSAVVAPPASKVESKRSKSGNDSDDRENKRSRIARSRSRSKSPQNRRMKGDMRDTDDRRNRRFADDDRRRRNFPFRRYDNRYREFRRGSGPDVGGSDRDRDGRLNHRSKDRLASGTSRGDRGPNDRSKSRSRSTSPWKRNRSRSWSRSRSCSRSRSRSHSGRSRSRSWSRSKDRNRDAGRGENRDLHTQPSGGSNEHGDKDYRNNTSSNSNKTPAGSSSGPTGPGSGPPPIPSEAGQPGFRSKHARRCRDYDEKGYCMRGDLCPFDHGMDPVVLENVSVLGFGPNSGNAPPPPPNHGSQGAQPPPPPPPPVSGAPLPPPPPMIGPPIIGQPSNHGPPPGGSNMATPLPPQAETFLPEPYNPEAPGMERPGRVPTAFWNHPPPTNVPGVGPPMRPMGPRGPPPHMFHGGPQQRTRELIGVPTIDNPEISGPKSVICRTVLEPLHPGAENSSVGLNQDGNHMRQPHMNFNHRGRGGGPDGGGFFRRRIFDYNRLGPRKMPQHSMERCTLELRKVPRHQNTISQLNAHFSKFGNIVNLQVCFGGDPEAALVQFSSHNEANMAYRCTDAVLNNRFIKVFWHNKENNNNGNNPVNSAPAADSTQPSNPAPTSTQGATENQEPSSVVMATADSENTPVVPAVTKPSIKERLGVNLSLTKVNNLKKNVLVANNADDSTEKVVLFTPTGNLSRTVFNPAALKKNNVTAGNAAVRKSKEEQKKDALKKKLEVQTKRQEIIQLHVQHQKILMERLEKCKTDKEKIALKESLVGMNKTIEQLQSEVRKEATEISTLNKAIMQPVPKTKTEPALLSKAEKELLDAEMDLYNKQYSGDDTTDLKKRVFDLRLQAKSMGLVDSSGHLKVAAFARGGIRFRGGRGGARVPRKLTSFDRRPKKLLVDSTSEIDCNGLSLHFSQYAQVDRLEMVGTSILVTFKTRRDAEKVITSAATYHGQLLKFSWFSDVSSVVDDAALEAALESDLHGNDDALDQSEEEDILLGDDEEEEDSEARSWRR